MNYRNAQDIFPEQLLKQIQRYVSGETIYIPASEQKKKVWGESSGYRAYLAKRNQAIRDDFAEGCDIDSLSDKYCLSVDSVKHIVYTKKETPMLEYNKTLSSALSYAKESKIDEWIHMYLLEDGRNVPFSDGLKLFERYYIGPVKMPLELFHRCTGPEENMKYRIDKDWWPIHVAALEDSIKKDPDMPPLIVHYVEDDFELNDGNTRFQAYTNLGVKEVNVIVWITEEAEYQDFLKLYEKYVQGAPVIRR